jgi:3'(2'), 5'-bisphosphate nucleotidase
MNYSQLRLLALTAAIKASDAIMDIYQTPFAADTKTDGSPVTMADIRANVIIEDILKPSGLPVFSEESAHAAYAVRRNWDAFWLVDPLDGTKEFIHRNGEFTVNIALIQSGKPVLGVVAAPASGTAWSGLLGEGVYIYPNITSHHPETQLAGTSIVSDPTHQDIRIVISRSHADKTTQSIIDDLQHTHPHITAISRGSSIKLCEIACGSADIYPRYAPTHEWDTAAGHALVIASGGQVVNAYTGRPLAYNKMDTLNPSFIAFRKDLPTNILQKFLL